MGGGGGGSGGFRSTAPVTSGGFGGYSLNNGLGGNGGMWFYGYTACTVGRIPGGGGGGALIEPAGGSNHTGCAGARGEVRVYY